MKKFLSNTYMILIFAILYAPILILIFFSFNSSNSNVVFDGFSLRWYKELFQEGCMYQVKPYDGIRELLAALKEKEVALAVLSNKPHAETIHVIETLFGKGYFDVIQGQKENVAIKPSPEGAFQIFEQLALTPDDVLYLGDTATDMKTGKSAGAFTLGALWGFRDRKELEEAGADAIIEHPLELLQYL